MEQERKKIWGDLIKNTRKTTSLAYNISLPTIEKGLEGLLNKSNSWKAAFWCVFY